MSTIDSGLGWSCDSDYYVDTAGILGTYGGHTISKTNAGAAFCANYKYNDGVNPMIYGAVIFSTVADYVAATGNMGTESGQYTIDGVTWYKTNIYNVPAATSTMLTDYPLVETIITPQMTAEQQYRLFLQAANVQPTAKKIPTTDYVKDFVEGVEAETASRVNALNTEKQPKTMSSAVSVGGVSQSTVEGAIGAMATKISKIDFDISRNLGTEITTAQKVAIANGTFEDLPIGAYWTLNNTVYRIAHHDYYLGTGDTACTSHHVVVVPDNNMYSAAMNDANTTEGGYAGSKMRAENLAAALAMFETDFGAAHILNHRIIITNAVSNGQASGWVWVDSKVDLMSENIVYGHTVFGQSPYETGIERGQLALFSLYPEFIQKSKNWYWLQSVSSSFGFSTADATCVASSGSASTSAGVRPYACIYFDDVLT